MSSFRKITKKYRFFKRKSRRNTLYPGSFIPLDVVRVSKNSFDTSKVTDIKSNLPKQRQQQPSKTVIAEMDSEADEIIFVDKRNQVNIDSKSVLSEHKEVCQSLRIPFEKEDNSINSKVTVAESDSDYSLDEITDTYGVNETKESSRSACTKEDSSIQENFKEANNSHSSILPNIAEDPEIKHTIETSMKYFKYQTTSMEKKKLARLAIKTRYLVLPQHEVESTAGTRALTATEIVNFIKYVPLKQGNFNNTEDETIKENWKTFCKDNHWDPNNPKPFLFMKHKNKEFLMFDLENRKRFVQCLAHGLPGRSLYNVFHRFKILFDPHKKERYTEKEDKTILQFMAANQSKKSTTDNDRPYADLAAILSRTRDSVWRRYNFVLKKI